MYEFIFQDWRENHLGAIDTEIMKAANKYEKVALGLEPTWQALDPAVVSLFLRPDLVAEYKYSKNDITVCGKFIIKLVISSSMKLGRWV